MDESIFIIGAIVSIVSAFITMEIYKSKNRPSWNGFALGLFLGVIGIVIALIVSSQPEEITYKDRVASGEMKVCPQCRNVVLSSVNVCPKCGHDVSQIIPRLADLRETRKETREEKEAREREAAKRELILGGKIFLGLIVVAVIVAIVLALAQ